MKYVILIVVFYALGFLTRQLVWFVKWTRAEARLTAPLRLGFFGRIAKFLRDLFHATPPPALLLFLALAVTLPGLARADELPAAPTPKRAAKAPKESPWALALTAATGGTALYDGVTTRKYMKRWDDAYEGDRLSRLLLGNRPTWKTMLPVGAVEVAGSHFLARAMRRSDHWYLNRTWWVPQAALIAAHAWQGTHNVIVLRREGSRARR